MLVEFDQDGLLLLTQLLDSEQGGVDVEVDLVEVGEEVQLALHQFVVLVADLVVHVFFELPQTLQHLARFPQSALQQLHFLVDEGLEVAHFGLQLFRVDRRLLYFVVYACEDAVLEDVGVVIDHESEVFDLLLLGVTTSLQLAY